MKKSMRVALSIVSCFPLSLGAVKNTTRWIVATTINAPTPAIKQLAALEDWHLVVVGDKKTPADWQLDGCEYLSPQMQEQLPYAIIALTPWNHYSRKNIGYLYAIEHGATVIYETDDDNILLCNTISYAPSEATMLSCTTKSLAFNVCRHFRQAHVWLRGYPVEMIHDTPLYGLQPVNVHPYIQSMLVDNDPDVDAIYRLTHELPVFFDHSAPALSLAPHLFCPYNTQSTISHYAAFWGLVVPITPTFRVCDIWRGYWVQRLLWDIGGVISFLPPIAWQERNAHNYLADFNNELDLYRKAGAFIALLNSWNSDAQELSGRIRELMDTMVTHGFFGAKENDYMRAWLADLERIGYRMPQVIA